MKQLQRFRTNEGGSTAVIFGMSLLPVMALAGAAVDYARASNVRTHLQGAVDSTALLLAHKAGEMSDGELQSLGQSFFEGLMPERFGAEVKPIKVAKNARTVDVSVEAVVPNRFLSVIGNGETPVATRTSVVWGTRKIELALVLDNTGSMASSNKLKELKKASLALLDTLEAASGKAGIGAIKVSLVPFATQVNVGTANSTATWLDFSNPAIPANQRTTPAAWQGCVADRDMPNDIKDSPTVNGDSRTLYPAVKCQYTPALQPIVPLTDSFGTLRTAIGGMTATGNTNITIGLAHGLATLSPAAPYAGAAAFGTADVEKFMVVLTDGENTQSRFTANAGAIDGRTLAACTEAKAGDKVKLYTIRVINGDANLLRSCATSPEMYKDVKNAAELDETFQSIADEILAIRISS